FVRRLYHFRRILSRPPHARRGSESDDRRPHPLGELTVASGSQTLKAHGNRTRDSRDRKVNAGRSAPARLPWRAARRLRGPGAGIRGPARAWRYRSRPPSAPTRRSRLVASAAEPTCPRARIASQSRTLAATRAWRSGGLGAVKMLPEGRSPWHLDHSVPPSRTDFPIRPCRHSRSARAAEVRQPEEQILVRPEQHNQQQKT